MQARLEHALKFFKKSQWGKGLTYNLMGRTYVYKSTYDFNKAQDYFYKAIECFQKIDHYRGTYVTLKDLHDLQLSEKDRQM